MSVSIIEVNDLEMRVIQSNRTFTTGPALSFTDNKHIYFGDKALQQLKLRPLNIINNFWQKMDLADLPPVAENSGTKPNSEVGSYADLVFKNLQYIEKIASPLQQVIFSVPDNYSSEQLSLLLGIADNCQFTTIGLINNAIASLPLDTPLGLSLHVDIDLHQIKISMIEIDENIKILETNTLDGCGVLTITDNLLRHAANKFIQKTRFNPLHSALFEQSLYEQILELTKNDKKNQQFIIKDQSITMDRSSIIMLNENINNKICSYLKKINAPIECIYTTHRCRQLPGLNDSIKKFLPKNTKIVNINEEALCANTYNKINFIDQHSTCISYLRNLPLKNSSTPSPQKNATRVSHLFLNNKIYSLDGCDLYASEISQSIELIDHEDNAICRFNQTPTGVTLMPLKPSIINGKTVTESTPLSLGDIIKFNNYNEEILAAGIA